MRYTAIFILFLVSFWTSNLCAKDSTDSLIYIDSRPYKLNWSDEFDAEYLDTSKWIRYYPHYYMDENSGNWVQDDQEAYSRLFHNFEDATTQNNQVFLNQNVVVKDGQCHLLTRKENVQWMGHERGYSSGMIHSYKGDFGPGVYEMKAKLGSGYLFSYAYWLFGGTYGEKPSASEIDIYEFFNRTKGDYESNLYKWYNYAIRANSHHESSINVDEWHTFRCVYDELTVRIFIDDMMTPVHIFYKYKKRGSEENIDFDNHSQIDTSQWQIQDYFPEKRHLQSLIISGGTIRNKSMIRRKKWTHRRSPDQNIMKIDYFRYYTLAPQARLNFNTRD